MSSSSELVPRVLVGVAHVLKVIGITRMVVLDHKGIGESFRRWPQEMRFITPSFTSNAFGLPDLKPSRWTHRRIPLIRNILEEGSIAEYLRAVVDEFQIPVEFGVNVQGVRPAIDRGGLFEVETSQGVLRSRFVIWPGGEFQYPNIPGFPEAELGVHASAVRSWKDVSAEDVLIVGVYESGIDAATTLCALGKIVTVLDWLNHWKTARSDHSWSLSPYVIERLRAAEKTGRLKLIDRVRVRSIVENNDNFLISGHKGRRAQTWVTSSPPLLAMGFVSSLAVIANLLSRDDKGWQQLLKQDESFVAPELFVCGPMVRHNAVFLYFIYKFHQRFTVVANAIGRD